MRRNLGSEVLIAIGGLSIIICGLFFALLLSNTSDNSGNGGATNVPSSLVTTAVESNTDDVDVTDASEITIQPTITNISNIIGTATAIALIQGKSTPEDETEEVADPEPETEELAQLASATIVFETSDTPSPSATNTEEPSDTPDVTNTRRPTHTSQPTSSNTPRPTATSTSVNAYTGIIPTLPPSPTVAPPNAPSRTPSSCQLPRGWSNYRVQSGDTLFAISLVTNSTVDELRSANCIDDIDNITAGDLIFVPILPIRPVSTAVPSGIRQGLTAIGCSSPTTQITSPITAQRVSGSFTVFGTATRPDFQYYKIEVRPDFASIYNFYSDSRTQVVNGALGQINADLFGPGLHWVRLSVVDIRAEIPADAICEIPVIFE